MKFYASSRLFVNNRLLDIDFGCATCQHFEKSLFLYQSFLFSNLSVSRLFYHTAHKLEGIIFVEQASPESKY